VYAHASVAPGARLEVPWPREFNALAPRLEILLLGGRPIRETVAFYGPFVMNTREEIIQAIADYRAGRMGVEP
jgi:redox-sensitive bicupin YhaK (pirin superfamily)